jgi:hypothetical protein
MGSVAVWRSRSRFLCLVGCGTLALCLTSVRAAAASGWAIQPTPTPTGSSLSALSAVACTSATACTAVGRFENNSGTLEMTLALRWDGRRWSIQRTPKTAAAISSDLTGVSCTSATACIAVGTTQHSIGPGSFGPPRALAERWNGSKWSIQQVPSHGAQATLLNGVSCVSARACFAVGGFITSAGNRVALAERWDGRRWSIQRTASSNPGVGELSSVACTSPKQCFAVGTGAERWNGRRWSMQRLPNRSGLSSVSG